MNERDTEARTKPEIIFGHFPPLASARPALVLFSLCLCASVVNLSCGSKRVDLSTLVPADTLVYLETDDLGAALQPIIDSKPFNEAAKRKPDLSALKGVQVAVAVTGFKTSEEKLTEEHSVGKIQPRFVAIADTQAWNFQAVRFAEEKLGGFVAKIYDSEPKIEKTNARGGDYFIWTAADGRKAYALVIDSLIYFGNDESAIDRALAVRRGQADSIAKIGKAAAPEPGTLASGYISSDGVAQLAELVALRLASDASDEPEVQSAIAGIIPRMIRSTVTDVTWAQTKTEAGIEDKWQIGLPQDVANIFVETMAPGRRSDPSLIGYLPPETQSASLYQLKDPRLAWQSAVLVAQNQASTLARPVIAEFSKILFEPYGVGDPEGFLLASADANLLTANLSPDGEKPLVFASLSDRQKMARSLSKALHAPKGVARVDVIWESEDGELGALFADRVIIAGDLESARAIDRARRDELNAVETGPFKQLTRSDAVVVSTVRDGGSAAKVAEMLSSKRSDDVKAESVYLTETRFNNSGMERTTVSDFGFIGWLLAQLGDE